MDPHKLEKLAPLFEGEVILPSDRRYADAARVWNRAVSKAPAAVIRCASNADILRSIEIAHSEDLPVAVRAGGHSYAGHGVCDRGIVIDLTLTKRVVVDPARRTVAVEAGVLAGELDDKTEPFGLATPLGSCRDVGVAGYALGGGEGALTPRLGYGCDNLTRAQIILADARILTTSDEQHPELFWAIRGAGANFGIVTAMEFKLHPVSQVLSGHLQFPFRDARSVLRFVSGFASQVPDDLFLIFSVVRRSGQPILDIGVVWSGDLKAGEQALRPLLSHTRPARNTIAIRSYFEEQRAGSNEPHGAANRRRAGHFEHLGVGIIEVMLEHLEHSSRDGDGITLMYWHGPWSSEPDDNAFGFRRAGYEYWIHTYWQDSAERSSATEWVDAFFVAMRPFSTGAVYVNDLEEEGESRVRAAYGDKYDRLAQLKARFDPENFFRSNQNIVPAGRKAIR